MKRFLIAATLVAVVLASFASSAMALGRNGIYLKTDQLAWRTHKAALVLADQVGGYVDSMAFNRVGAGGATMSVANAETTTAISTTGWSLLNAAPGLLDSSLTCRVIVSDAGSTSSAVDSLQLAIQVSPDGNNWLYVNQIVGTSAGTNPITSTTPQVASFTMLNLAGSSTTTPKIFSYKFSNSQASGLYPDRFNFWQYPLVRFILLNKTVGAVQHNFNIRVVHWATESEQ